MAAPTPFFPRPPWSDSHTLATVFHPLHLFFFITLLTADLVTCVSLRTRACSVLAALVPEQFWHTAGGQSFWDRNHHLDWVKTRQRGTWEPAVFVQLVAKLGCGASTENCALDVMSGPWQQPWMSLV